MIRKLSEVKLIDPTFTVCWSPLSVFNVQLGVIAAMWSPWNCATSRWPCAALRSVASLQWRGARLHTARRGWYIPPSGPLRPHSSSDRFVFAEFSTRHSSIMPTPCCDRCKGEYTESLLLIARFHGVSLRETYKPTIIIVSGTNNRNGWRR
jgi:hypothetical protein